MFDLHSSQVYRALRYPSWVIVPLQIFLGALAVLFLLFFLFPKPFPQAGDLAPEQAMGWFLMLASVNVWCVLYWMFYLLRLRHLAPPMPLREAMERLQGGGALNFADFLDLDAGWVVGKAILFARKKRIALSPLVMLSVFLKHPRADFLFSRLLIHKAAFEKSVEVIVHSQFMLKPSERALGAEFSLLMQEALKDARDRGERFITFSSALAAAVASDRTIQRLFLTSE